MNYTIELNAAQLQVIGEALAIAPMPNRQTIPVMNVIQAQINAQEVAAQKAARAPLPTDLNLPNETIPKRKYTRKAAQQNGAAEQVQP